MFSSAPCEEVGWALSMDTGAGSAPSDCCGWALFVVRRQIFLKILNKQKDSLTYINKERKYYWFQTSKDQFRLPF